MGSLPNHTSPYPSSILPAIQPQFSPPTSRDFLKKSKLGMGPSFIPSPLPQKKMPVIHTFPSIMSPNDNKLAFPPPSTIPNRSPTSRSSDNSQKSFKLLTPQQQQILDQEHRKNVAQPREQETAIIDAVINHLLDITN